MESATKQILFLFTSKIYKKMEKKLLSATIFYQPGTLRPRKYRNISKPDNFLIFAKKSNGIYVNFYDQKTKEYKHRVYLQ
jgi:hypothetical protein